MSNIIDTPNSVNTVSRSLAITQKWQNGFQIHAPLTLLIALYLLISAFFLSIHDPEALQALPLGYIGTATGSCIMFIAVLILYFVVHILTKWHQSPFGSFATELRHNALSGKNLPNLFFAWACLVFLLPTFVDMKGIIPKIHEFSYDPMFHDIDKWLHFGTHPYEWIQPLFFAEWTTMAVHRNYYIWFTVIFMTYCWQAATTKNPELRLQFLLSFLASWVFIGTFLAICLSSTGPIFIDRLTNGEIQSYNSQVAYLEQLNQSKPLVSLKIRDALWAAYTGVGPTVDFTKGISAMPSMHVAISFLLVLFGWRKGKFAGIAYTLFGILILLGSVHLLWHYAIDGYVSILVVGLIWCVSGKISRHTFSKTPV